MLLGPRGSAVETAFCNALTNNKDGFTTLLAVVAPNLLCKPPTILYNKVTIKDARQAVQMFGPAQYAVAKAVADSVSNVPADLSRFPLIHYASSCHRWDVDSYLFEAGLALDVIAEIDDPGLLIAAAEAQPSIIAVPERSVKAYVEAGRLFRLCSVGNVVSCVYAQFLHRPPSTIVRAALDLLAPE